MDEFTAMGRVRMISKAVSYMAGYNLRLLPIIQSLSQLSSVYGQEEARTFITNHALQILYAPREQRDANEISDLLGYETVIGKSVSKSLNSKQNGRSESESDQRRALLLPQELKELGQWKQIISLENMKPILCDKIKYFEDSVFKKRLFAPISIPLLDMNTYRAKVEGRVRTMVIDDIQSGIDLEKVAINFSNLRNPEPEDDSIENFVHQFFDLLDDADKTCPNPIPTQPQPEPKSSSNEDIDANAIILDLSIFENNLEKMHE